MASITTQAHGSSAGEHPLAGPAIEAAVVAERGRIARLARVLGEASIR